MPWTVVLDWRKLIVALRHLQRLRRAAQLQPLVGSHRIRARIDQCGTATGRVILSDPPMQQVLHEFSIKNYRRPYIQDEIEQQCQAVQVQAWGGNRPAAMTSIAPAPPLPAHLYTDVVPSVLSWTASTAASFSQDGRGAVHVAAIRTDSCLWATEQQAQETHLTSQFGVLRCILSSTVSDPFLLQRPNNNKTASVQGGFGPSSSSLVDVHELIHSTESLASYWYRRGFEYDDEDAHRIRQVLVEFPPTSVILTYPADKVFRRPPGLENPQELAMKAFGDEIQDVSVSPRDACPAARGFVLISADYSQIELRILAHFARDDALMEALTRDEDVFRSLAATWKRVP